MWGLVRDEPRRAWTRIRCTKLPSELPAEDSARLGEPQFGFGDHGLVLGAEGPSAGGGEESGELHPRPGPPPWGGDEGLGGEALLSVLQLDVPGLGGGRLFLSGRSCSWRSGVAGSWHWDALWGDEVR